MIPPEPIPSTLVDGFNRRISYLRLSVTDRCNLRCSYCMPAGGIPWLDKSQLLTRDELVLLAQVAVKIGIRKIRVTGGEPLLRPDIVELLGEIGSLPGLERLVLTTNGVGLPKLAPAIKAAGVSGLNVSIDSLRADRFAKVTRGGSLPECRASIDSALAAGFRVKLNVVVMAGVNDDEILDFVDLASSHPLAVRFIEYMPTRGKQSDPLLTVPSDRILDIISSRHQLTVLTSGLHAGPARRFRVDGWPGTVGIISPVSCHFCNDCNRIRVTANGMARSCLFHEAGLDLRPWLKNGDAEGLAGALKKVVEIKPETHNLTRDGRSDEDDIGPVIMSRLGG